MSTGSAFIGGKKDQRWWLERNPHETVWPLSKTLEQRLSYRREQNLHFLRLYGDRVLSGLTPGTYARDVLSSEWISGRRTRLSLNVVRNIVDAATSKMTKARPRPVFLTSGSSWEKQRRAKARTNFVDALFSKEKAYALGQRAFRNACIFGTGLVKLIRDAGRPRLELAFTGEILVDDAEAVYGDPRSLYQVRAMDRLVLKAMFPKHAKRIEDAQSADTRYFGRDTIGDLLLVVEGWHLPSGREAEDGRHVVVVADATLVDEPYRWPDFPFAVMRWNEEPLGFYGSGIPQQIAGIQYEINQLVRALQMNAYMGGNLKVLVERGSKIIKAQLSNDLRGVVVEYTGQPPQWVANDVFSPQLLQYLNFLVNQAYAITGVSQMTARSESFASTSGRARLVESTIESERFMTVGRNYESFFMALAERCLEACEDLHESKNGLVLNYAEKGFISPIRYEDARLERDDYEIQVWPTSILPITPAGRFAMVEELRGAGYVDQEQARRLLDFPDLQREVDLSRSPMDLIDARIQTMLEQDVYLPPDPQMDLSLALRRASLYIQEAEIRGVPDERIDHVRDFHGSVLELLARQQAAAAPSPSNGAANKVSPP